jgi:hypothetical protein
MDVVRLCEMLNVVGGEDILQYNLGRIQILERMLERALRFTKAAMQEKEPSK